MRALQLFLLTALTLTLSGCEAIGAIFEAGLWTGIILVVVILAVIGFIVSRFRRPR